MAKLPEKGSGTLMEDDSERLVDAFLHPWELSRPKRDVGIDFNVMIYEPTPTGAAATGKQFAIQLKATDSEDGWLSVRVDARSLRLWTESTLPVLLISCHRPTERLAGVWIDDDLLAHVCRRSPDWLLHETVTIPISADGEFGTATKNALEAYVRRDHRRSVILQPGTYNRLQSQAIGLAERLAATARSADLSSIQKRMDDLVRRLRSAMYTVAIAGPARQGKSQLLCSIVGNDISPVGEFTTTAVPIIVRSGAQPCAVIHFDDGRKQTAAASGPEIRRFADQSENEDNAQSVRFIEVTLASAFLEKGISLVDLPGLRDASPAVRNATMVGLETADAIIYVLSAARMKDGEFSLDDTLIRDLNDFGANKDRVALVLNKSDTLNEDQRRRLLERVHKDLAKYGVNKYLAAPPFLLSADAAARARKQGGTGEHTELDDFENWLEGYLLGSGRTGLQRLLGAASELASARESLEGLLALRAADGSKASDVARQLEGCRKLARLVRGKTQKFSMAEHERIGRELQQIVSVGLATLEAELRAVPADEDLPDQSVIKNRVDAIWREALGNVWRSTVLSVNGFAARTQAEVNSCLKRAMALVQPNPSDQFLFPEDVGVLIPEASFGEVWASIGGGALVGAIFGPLGAAIGAAVAWVTSWFASARTRRTRQLNQMFVKCRDAMEKVRQRLEFQLRQKSDAAVEVVRAGAVERLDSFVHDAERQLGELTRHGPPIDGSEKKRLDDLREQVSAAAVAVGEWQTALHAASLGVGAKKEAA